MVNCVQVDVSTEKRSPNDIASNAMVAVLSVDVEKLCSWFPRIWRVPERNATVALQVAWAV